MASEDEDEDDDLFSNLEKDFGDDLILEWARVSFLLFLIFYISLQ